ncbi:MAG: helix-hairpin-helix domain-containing protein [Deltaproteobacteria bacterium]|nr:helix-hairpin-helix domain-containing protein [Deltaproteobacteria bacterium]
MNVFHRIIVATVLGAAAVTPVWVAWDRAGVAARPCACPFAVEQRGSRVLVCADGNGSPPGLLAALGTCASRFVGERPSTAGELWRLDDGCRRTRSMLPGRTRLLLGLRLDLNAAAASELEALPRIGPALAARIVRRRQWQGRFRQVTELREVKGIGAATLQRLAPFVCVGETCDVRRAGR